MGKFININKSAALTVSKAQKALTRILKKKGMGHFQARSIVKGGTELSFENGGEKGLKQFTAGVSKGIQGKSTKHYKTFPKRHRAFQFQSDWERGHKSLFKEKPLPTQKQEISLNKKLLAGGSLAAAAGSLYILSGNKSKRGVDQSLYPYYARPSQQSPQYIRTKLREM